MDWSDNMVKAWLIGNMFDGEPDAGPKAENIVKLLGSHIVTSTHSRHIHIDECKNMGIKVKELESLDKRKLKGCKDLQDCVLTIHHSYMHTFSNSAAVKIVENHNGNAMIMNSAQMKA